MLADLKRRFDRVFGWVEYAIALVAAVALLQFLAWESWSAHLLAQSARTMAALERGDTPYRWAPRHERDLVAGRLFGSNAYEFDERGLRVEGNGEAFQVGLPFSGAIDLALYDRIELEISDVAAAQTTLVVRETLNGPMRFALVPAGVREIDPATLAWDDEFGAAVSTPRRFAMLRIQAQPPKGEPFRLSAVRLLPSQTRVDYAPWVAVKPGPINIPEPAPGIVMRYALDSRQTLEAAMIQRDRLLLRAPTALFVQGSNTDQVEAAARAFADAGSTSHAPAFDLRWPALALYAAALLLLRVRPPRNARLRAALEAAGALLAPFGLVIGGFVGDNPDAWIALVAAVSLAFALSLDRIAPWRWLGAPRTWVAPVATVALAAALAAWLHRTDNGFHWPDRITLLRYLAWVVLQQYLICVVLADRLARIDLAPRWIAFAAALVFALLHTPNAMLMLATFAGGLAWSRAWVRHRALLPLVAAHVASATILIACLPPEILRSAEVSARFFL